MERSAGLFVPVTSLPSPYGIGTLGRAAYRFLDFLQGAGCKIWQVLPLQPTGFGNSPYQSCSASALNPYLIDLDLLYEEGLLGEKFRSLDWGTDGRRVDYGRMYALRSGVLREAFSRFNREDPAWQAFCKAGEARDFALFMALKEAFGGSAYTEWGEYAEYEEERVARFEEKHKEDVRFWEFTQFLFLRQWKKLKEYAAERGVKLMGDMPIYLARDSVEMWKYKGELFALNSEGNPALQAGVPPDAFSETGQLWGNPVYDWAKMQGNGYRWWRARLQSALKLYDFVRIDHFIGFIRYYCIPEGETDARKGEWRKGPGKELFEGFEEAPIVAEDLGLMTEEVRAAIDEIGYPGMRILQHAFDGNPKNEHKPANYTENLIAYTGTHDNVTLLSRIRGMRGGEKKRMKADLKKECAAAGVRARTRTAGAVHESIFRLLYASRANAVIVPLQDALCMGDEARLNFPSDCSDRNWTFRFLESDFSVSLKRKLKGYAERYGR